MSSPLMKACVVLFTFGVLACSPGARPAFEGNYNQSQVTSEPAGAFVETADASARAISPTCTATSIKLDDRLAVGQKFEFEDRFSYVGGGITDADHRIVSIDSIDRGTNKIIELVQLKDLSLSYRQTCSFEFTPEEKTSCTPDPGSLPLLRSKPVLTEKNCAVMSDSAMTSAEKTTSGTYTFKSGNKVTAVKTIRKEAGNIECDGRPQATGTTEVTEIRSPDVAELNSGTCGAPTLIFSFKIVKDSSGHTIAISKHELVSVP